MVKTARVAVLLAGLLTVGLAVATGPSTPAKAVGKEVAPVVCPPPPGGSQAAPSTATEAGRRDGWRFAIADDTSPPAIGAALGDRFARLRPKTFRLQVQWDAASRPADVNRARDLICQARAQGVQQIVVTFRGDFARYYQPRAVEEYRPAVRKFVRQFGGLVDAWGPANEPNLKWLPGTSGAKKLARYYKQPRAVQKRYDPTALLLSPELHDYGTKNKKRLGTYINTYVRAGGGFGDVIGWHPYVGLNHRPRPSTASTADFLDILSHHANARSQKVWITEVGAFGPWHNTDKKESLRAQNRRVSWLVGPRGFLRFQRITRIYYYDMQAVKKPNPKDTWDSGLSPVSETDPGPRPAWRTWCVASHGGDTHHPDCLN